MILRGRLISALILALSVTGPALADIASDTALLRTDAALMHSVIHGAANQTVTTEGGAVKTMAGALQTITAFNVRGAWGTTTAYALKDVVIVSSVAYVCVAAHTSGVWATDLAAGKWVVHQGVTLEDLASTDPTKGAALIGFKRSETGAVARTAAAKLGETVSVQDFGATGDGVTDDSAAIQAAIDSLGPSGGVVNFPAGTYKCNSRLNITTNNVRLSGSGFLNFSGITGMDGSYLTAIKVYGTGPDATKSSALSANATVGSYTVTVADGSKFAAGDWVQLTAEDTYPFKSDASYLVKRGEIKQVESVVSNTVQFRQAVYEAYTTANTATLTVVNLVSGFRMEGLKIVGTNVEGDHGNGLRMLYVRDFGVSRCTFLNVSQECLAVWSGIDGKITKNRFDGVRYTGSGSNFYGIALYGNSQWVQVEGNSGSELRHLVVTSAGSAQYGQPYHCQVIGNSITNAMAGDSYASYGYENHGFGRWITWANNQADGCYAGINLERGDQVVTGNIFRNCRFVGILFADTTSGYDFSNILVENNHVSGVTTESTSGQIYGVFFPANANHTRSNIKISGNLFDGFDMASRVNFILRVNAGNGAAINCSFEGNTCKGASPETNDEAVYLDQAGWSISRNKIYGFERAIRGSANASACNFVGNEIEVASFAGTEPFIRVASNDCVVTDNIFRGGYKAILINSGVTGTNVSGNVEVGVSASSDTHIAFHATKTASQTIGAGPTTVTFDTASSNVGSSYSTATNTFTAPVAGYYQFGMYLEQDATSTAGEKFTTSIIAGTSTFSRVATMATGINSFGFETPVIYLAKDATVYVTCTRLSGTHNLVTNNEPTANYFFGYLVR